MNLMIRHKKSLSYERYVFTKDPHGCEAKLTGNDQGFYILEILDFPLTVTPAKISLLIFYARIFPVRKFQICSYVLGSFVLALGIAILFQTIFQCSPISYGWDRSIDNGSCIHQMVFYRAVSPLNVLTGVLILVLPMPLVWRLHAPRGQKLALTGVFLLGGL